MRSVPIVVLARFRFTREPPLFYLHVEGGPHHVSWHYTELTYWVPHTHSDSYSGAGIGAGVLLPASALLDLEFSVTLVEMRTEPERTRYVRVLFGVALSDDTERQVRR
jgi:hypothetical protein